MAPGCGYLRVVNWEKHQHYGDRTPPWIKLHVTTLEDSVFAALPDATKAHVVGIWILAARLKNKIPADPGFIAKRINATGKVDLNLLIRTGFLEPHPDTAQVASAALAKCSLDKEEIRGEERREEQEQRPKMSNLEEAPPEQRAPIDAYNVTFGTNLGYTPGNLKAVRRAFSEGYTLDTMRAVFQAVKDRSTSSAAWCADRNREFEYLIRPTYINRDTREPVQSMMDRIPNELATGRGLRVAK